MTAGESRTQKPQTSDPKVLKARLAVKKKIIALTLKQQKEENAKREHAITPHGVEAPLARRVRLENPAREARFRELLVSLLRK